MHRRFSGSLVALITPFNDDEVDYDALAKLVEWHIDQGSHGLVPVGTTGESPTLSLQEHQRIVQTVVECAAGRVPVIAGCGSSNTREAIGYHKFAAEAGADAALHVTGYYNRPSQEGVVGHFSAISDAADLPIIVYNTPPRTGVDILPETMVKLAALSNIVGVKDATGDLARICLEQALLRRDFVFLSGEDMTALAYNASGGIGCISVTANVAPRACAQMQQACLDDDLLTARAIHKTLVPLHRDLFLERSPCGVKYACSLLNLCQEDVRLPLTLVSEDTKHRIKKSLGPFLPAQ